MVWGGFDPFRRSRPDRPDDRKGSNMARRQLIFHNDEYSQIGGNILKAIAHEPKGDNATAEGFFNWLAGPVKDVVQGVMWRKELESLITLGLSGCAFANAKWKSDVLKQKPPWPWNGPPPQDVSAHKATLDRLFWLTVPLPTDLHEETKRKCRVMLEDDYRLIQNIPELIIQDVAKALQWLKGEFDARVVGLRSAAQSGKFKGRDKGLEQTIQQVLREQLDQQAEGGRRTRPNDLITLAVAVTRFFVSRVTLLRAIGDGRITSHRALGASKNSPHLVSDSEVARYCVRKPRKQ